IEAVVQNQQQPPSISELIAQVFKNHIALLDASLTAVQYTFGFDRLNVWVAPLRIAAIAQGIYRLQSDPNANTEVIANEIFVNMLNVCNAASRILANHVTSSSARTFLESAAVVCIAADAVRRIWSIVKNRTDIYDKMGE